jgi:hypothetical protein
MDMNLLGAVCRATGHKNINAPKTRQLALKQESFPHEKSFK